MAKYKCPKGHAIETADGPCNPPVCDECGIIGGHHNPRLGVVYSWTKINVHESDCRQILDEIDAAFDNQYFGGEFGDDSGYYVTPGWMFGLTGSAKGGKKIRAQAGPVWWWL